MSLYGAFTNAAEALQAQSSALGVISQNVANVNTVGYKQPVENFQTVLSESQVGPARITGADGPFRSWAWMRYLIDSSIVSIRPPNLPMSR